MHVTQRVDQVATGLLVAMVGLLAAWQVWGDRWGWLGLLNAWAEWTQRAALFLAGWLVARGHPEHALLALPAAVIASPVPGVLPASSHPTDAEPFTLFSANLYIHNQRIERHVELALELQPDLICLQEFKPAFVPAFEAGLAGDYPYRALRPHVDAFGFGVYSRLPLEQSALWSEPGVRPFAQRVYVQVPGGTIALYNVHLCPPAAKSTLQHGLTWGFRTREAQVAFLQAEIERDGLPAILVGDYNFSEPAKAYRMAVSRWQDAWLHVGTGPRWTWPARGFPISALRASPPLLRLDYCFLSGDVRAHDLRHLSTRTGSDHRVLLAMLELPE